MITGLGVYRVDALAAELPITAWQRISAGRGAKGRRYYDWCFGPLPHATDAHGGHHWLLIRRNRRTGELATTAADHLRSSRCALASRSLGDQGIVPRRETGLGLDQHQQLRWPSWNTVAILAHATAEHRNCYQPIGSAPWSPLTVNELRHLFHVLIIEPSADSGTRCLWSIRRRRHQARAMNSHYTPQALMEP
ncbi:hypothetical protein [Micromonospora inaquosa]|uniref:Uncharacterized protein n=1 Tax=Micromonospora inaquosa TaxID=2203716 RepID=A0A3N9WSL8_9ACTN|nr:hypothetical protein [Micromonospora inaquosa]RQX03858.1 hypothetical protein DLJ59_11095 [Micromonospora inaquosa]